MQRELFIDKLTTETTDIDMNWIGDVLRKSTESNIHDGNPKGHRNLIIVMEELAELAKEISKELRGKGDYINILEELADVQLGIYYVQEICGIETDKLHKAMKIKMSRLSDVLQEQGRYK